MIRLGILGGTFNPPHLGHLVCAQEARWQLRLDRVLLVPVHAPPHKELADDPGAGRRAEMCRIAAHGEEGLEVSMVDVDRPPPSFTVDTLRAIAEGDPGAELVFIVGGDMALSLPTWRGPETILSLARLAVAERAGARRGDIEARLAGLHSGDRVMFFDMPRLDISSSALRRRVAEGRPIRHLVPDGVREYVAAEGLYRPAVGAR